MSSRKIGFAAVAIVLFSRVVSAAQQPPCNPSAGLLRPREQAIIFVAKFAPPDGSSSLLQEVATRAGRLASMPSGNGDQPVARPDDTRAQLLAAKALVFCGFPYKRTPQTTIVREARVGAGSHLTVYFSTTKLGVPIPYGADRALLAWITTLAYQSGWVGFDSLTSFFDAFHLGDARAPSTAVSPSGSSAS